MKTTFTIQTELAEQFEQEIIKADFEEAIHSIREGDFHTHFIFEDLNDEEFELLELIEKELF